jgi:hypothetical protein
MSRMTKLPLDILETPRTLEGRAAADEVAISRIMAAAADVARTTIVGVATSEDEGVVVVMEEVVEAEDGEAATITVHWMMLGRNPTDHQLRATMWLLHTRISHHCKSSTKLLSNWYNSNSSSTSNTSSRCRERREARKEEASYSISDTKYMCGMGLLTACEIQWFLR